MDTIHSILSVAAISAIGILSPGPDFLAVTYAAITKSRKQASAVAIGVILGNGLWVGSALIGIGALFALFPALFLIIKYFGALYLCWLGVKLLRNAKRPIEEIAPEFTESLWRSFRKGISTTLSNPKAAVFYASALSSAAPSSPGFIELSLMLLAVIMVATLWFGFVVMVLSTPRASQAFRKLKGYFEAVFGILLLGFGIRQLCSK